nr:hypothetical protein [Rhodococcus sp. 06-418-1B]
MIERCAYVRGGVSQHCFFESIRPQTGVAAADVHANDGKVVYELAVLADGEGVVLTPGDRFGKDFGVVPGLARAG